MNSEQWKQSGHIAVYGLLLLFTVHRGHFKLSQRSPVDETARMHDPAHCVHDPDLYAIVLQQFVMDPDPSVLVPADRPFNNV